MRIDSISVRIPTLELTNDSLIALVTRNTSKVDRAALATYRRKLLRFLELVGANKRYVRDRRKGETAIDLVKAAAHDAVRSAGLRPQDIDLLLYCSVGRGFLEPANAYHVAKSLGIRCACFDILDACMGWVRALDVASKYLESRCARRILIVNAEFNAYECGYPEAFRVKLDENPEHSLLPMFTIGEAAAATVVSESSTPWRFSFASLPELANLCSIPLPGFADFCVPDNKTGAAGPHRFAVFGAQLFRAATEQMRDLIRREVEDLCAADIWFPHVATGAPFARMARAVGVDPRKVFAGTFAEFGNVASASIPVAMHSALGSGALVRGYRVVLCPASAGVALAVVQFVF